MSDPFVSAYTQIEGELELDKWFEMGGKGSGHHGHKGIKGRRGGSAPSRSGGISAHKLTAPPDERYGLGANSRMHGWLSEAVPGERRWDDATTEERANLKAQVAQNLSDASGVTPQEASDFVQQWAHSSNDDDMRSLAVQQDAAKEFGLKTSEFTDAKIKENMGTKRDYVADLVDEGESLNKAQVIADADPMFSALMESNKQRALMRSMYNETQAELKARGIKEVRLYRGVQMIPTTEIPNWGEMKGKTISVETNAVESWPVSWDVAAQFAASTTKSSVVLQAIIPAERILSTPATGFGCLTEGEVVVLGGIGGDQVLVSEVSP